MKLTLQLQFTEPGYIADPYRVAMYRLIEIQKQSGMMRARSEKKRRECLEAHLRDIGMTHDGYLALEKEAREPFYHDAAGWIVIPQLSIEACLVNACSEAPSKIRISNLRTALRCSAFVTDKREPDGVWERFAVVMSGQGKLSNQRGLRSNAYIRNFVAIGEIAHDPELVRPKAILDLLTYAGREIGIGASRKMGWGRFTVAVQS
jgi:hypothetical protein